VHRRDVGKTRLFRAHSERAHSQTTIESEQWLNLPDTKQLSQMAAPLLTAAIFSAMACEQPEKIASP
jgi:hypothetical protein